MTHICVSKLTIIASNNGLSPGWHQAIIWTNAAIGPLGTNFSQILIEIHTVSFMKIHLKMSFGKWRPFCLGPNMSRTCYITHIPADLTLLVGWISQRVLTRNCRKPSALKLQQPIVCELSVWTKLRISVELAWYEYTVLWIHWRTIPKKLGLKETLLFPFGPPYSGNMAEPKQTGRPSPTGT